MPIYEYQCETCEKVTDIKHGFKETTDATCPACGGTLKRLFNAAGIVFKGSGFYVTDSRKSGSGSDGSSKSGASKGDAPKSDAPKSDAPKSDATKSEAPKADAPKSEAKSSGSAA